MIFAKDLILKGVAGLAVVGGLGAGGIYVWNKRKEESLQFLTEKVGLECTAGTPNETTGIQCNKKNGSDVKVKVKQGSTNIDLSNITSGGGKIKVYKLTASDGGTTGYNQDFKFVIEDNDISESGNKLEQFETYEIKKEDAGNNWYLTRRDEANVGKEKALGLPTGCKLPSTTSTSTTCNDVVLDAGKLKLINFEGKGSTENLNVPDDANLKLTITKVTGSDTEFPNGGYKFVFKTDKDVTVNGTESSKNITIKKGADLEFKIKKATTGNGLTLEKAWTVTNLGKKVGLDCPEPSGETKECTLKENGINVHNGNNKKHTGLSRGDDNNNKKIKYEVDVEDYNQGFKFYTEEAEGITLKDGNNGDGKKIENKGSDANTAFYEIKEEGSTWYLIKKTPAPAA